MKGDRGISGDIGLEGLPGSVGYPGDKGDGGLSGLFQQIWSVCTMYNIFVFFNPFQVLRAPQAIPARRVIEDKKAHKVNT